MKTQADVHYERIANAIAFIRSEFKRQPSLEEIAAHVGLSAFHFQRLFTEWAGVSPKQFLQYISLEHAKALLRQQVTLSEAAERTGFSGSGRLHDLFVTLEGMTPGDYKKGGNALEIRYSFQSSPFGMLLVASTSKGICHMSFVDEPSKGLEELRASFPQAAVQEEEDALHAKAMQFFLRNEKWPEKISLHLRGTDFQLKVWQALLKIPFGSLTTYGDIARHIEQPRASRAVGTAIGSNPVAFIIPCHRVIQASGVTGGYLWHPDRKTAMIGWEASGENLSL